MRDKQINAMKGIETHTDEERQINSVTGMDMLHTDAKRDRENERQADKLNEGHRYTDRRTENERQTDKRNEGHRDTYRRRETDKLSDGHRDATNRRKERQRE